MYKTIKYEVAERIATITLNRPEVMNVFEGTMTEELVDAFDKADKDDDVRVVIVTGAGKAFCAGSELVGERPFDYGGNAFEHRDTGGRVAMRVYDMQKPVIAAINGVAVGIGITMTLSMDIRICSDKSKMGFVFASRGIVSEAASGWFLPRIVNIAKAMEWISTGRLVGAEEALEAGLVSYVVPTEEVYPKALEIARMIVSNTAPVSVALCRQLMYKTMGARTPMTAHKLESMLLQWIGTTRDADEGINSFREKRTANYTMSVNNDMPDFYPWWQEEKFPRVPPK